MNQPSLYYCNIKQDEEINERLYARNIPSSNLQPQFSMRPISTKYAFMPIVDRRAPSKVEKEIEPVYNISKTFNPGNAVAPWSGFASNISVESTLRNQYFALQNCQQSQYIPSSDSDLYKVQVTGQDISQPFPDLFKKPKFKEFDPNTCRIGSNTFNNNTRVQLLQKCNNEKVNTYKKCK